jgi:type II secretory pathway component GspD/PulD (secretin)
VVQLKHANAAAAAKLITDIFKAGAAGGLSPQQIQMMQQQGQPIPPGGGGGGTPTGGAIDQALRGGKVNAAADERTNTLVITAPTETLKVIDGLIAQLDANPTAGNTDIRVFTLKFARAEDTSKLITSIFKGEDDDNSSDYFWGFSSRRGNQDAALKVKVEAAFDERTNSVIVTAPKPTLDVIEA